LHAAYFQNPYQDKILFSSYDLVLINGNHYAGKSQILLLDKEKEASVRKRLDQITDVKMVIRLQKDVEDFDFLLEKFPGLSAIPHFDFDQTGHIVAQIEKIVDQSIPRVKGLVLAGGLSRRMGRDKGLINYFGKSQRSYTAELLKKCNLETRLSVRKEQEVTDTEVIEDVFLGLGPFGAICSAFQYDPNSAWLVLATDLPYVDESLIRKLLRQRDPSKVATAVKGIKKRFPEPLVTIWEPKAYPIMLQFLSQGISCPRKVLINSDVKLVETDDAYIYNVNTPEEFDSVRKDLEKHR
jgi:molybdopterin-guanine dinucleotide biosynthesis protein A